MENLTLFDESVATVAAPTEAELVAKLKAAEFAYYNGTALMEDAEYDILRDRLVEMNPNHPHLQLVGADVPQTSGFGKIKHSIPMGSQRKAKSKAEFLKWVQSVVKGLELAASDLVCQFSYKLDGGSIGLRFADGVLVEGSTRGDGFEGEDITSNAMKFRDIPKLVKTPSGELFTGCVRVEVVLNTEEWMKLDPLLEQNPRNVGNGIAQRSSGVDSELLQVVAFRAYNESGVEIADTESEMTRMMEQMGFVVAPSMVGSVEDVWEYFSGVETARRDGKLDFPFWIDGGVVKLDQIALQHDLGESDNRPKGQIALKFGAVGTPSVLESVAITVGHTGMITPTGAFKPVQISGTTVSSANLVNWHKIDLLDIAVGDSVELYKAGEIVPNVLRVTERPASRKSIELPACCPVCGGEVGYKQNLDGTESAHLFCFNPICDAKVPGKIGRFVNSLNILGIGDEVLEAMVESGLVSNVADLFTLNTKMTEFADLRMASSGRRLGDSSAASIVEEIEKRRNLTLPQLLGSLGVEGLGKRRVEKIIAAVPSKLNDLTAWLDGTLLIYAKEASIPNLAQVIHDSLQGYKSVIEQMFANGVTVLKAEVQDVKEGALSFCITGKLSHPKKVYEQMVKDAGHEWKGSVAKGLDYLVMADPNSGSKKIEKAEKVGVKCISEDEFIALLKG